MSDNVTSFRLASVSAALPAGNMWAKLPVIGGVLAVAGLGATLGSAMGHNSRAWFSYLWAFELVLSIALGALCFVMIDHVARAAWSVSVRRVAETAMATLPLFIILWIPIAALGMHDLYPWTHEADAVLERKRWFLSSPFFHGRAVLYLVVWCALALVLYRASVRQDALAGGGEERDALTRKMWKVSAAGLVLYALTQSFSAFDWMMSLQPHWYSTIYGVYFFAGSVLAYFAFATLTMKGVQRSGAAQGAVTTEHYHDLGKYLFGFTIFWAYIAFSQFVLIWYAGIPEETEFYLVRLQGGWEYITYALPLVHFFLPFFLLMSRHVKRDRLMIGVAAVWLLVVHAVDLFWNIVPNAGAHGGEGGHHLPHFNIAWTDATALIGMVGAFLAVFGYFLNSKPVICVGDPRLPESLVHENY